MPRVFYFGLGRMITAIKVCVVISKSYVLKAVQSFCALCRTKLKIFKDVNLYVLHQMSVLYSTRRPWLPLSINM